MLNKNGDKAWMGAFHNHQQAAQPPAELIVQKTGSERTNQWRSLLRCSEISRHQIRKQNDPECECGRKRRASTFFVSFPLIMS